MTAFDVEKSEAPKRLDRGGVAEQRRSAGARLGSAMGWVMAPAFGLVSFLRHARTFHPTGPVYVATATPHADAPPHFEYLAKRLSGRALVRFSGALWKHAEGIPDVLGCAIRLWRGQDEAPEPAPDDQDLLFATIKRPWTMPLSPFTTDVKDYLANDYFAVSPFDAGLAKPAYLRIHPQAHGETGDGPRSDRLGAAVGHGDAALNLEASSSPFGPWQPLLVITLERRAHVDGETLRFHPFHDGRGVHPFGFVHSLRRGVYALSQRTRPHEAH